MYVYLYVFQKRGRNGLLKNHAVGGNTLKKIIVSVNLNKSLLLTKNKIKSNKLLNEEINTDWSFN